MSPQVNQATHDAELDEIVGDAHQFVTSFGDILTTVGLQLYSGPLLFTPRNTAFRAHYYDPRGAQWTIRNGPEAWPAVAVFPGHISSVIGLAFSPN